MLVGEQLARTPFRQHGDGRKLARIARGHRPPRNHLTLDEVKPLVRRADDAQVLRPVAEAPGLDDGLDGDDLVDRRNRLGNAVRVGVEQSVNREPGGLLLAVSLLGRLL